MNEDFTTLIKSFIQHISSIWINLKTTIEKTTYISLVDCLKLKDEIAVKSVIDELVQEGNAISIPPIFLTSQRHPDPDIRMYSLKSLEKLLNKDELNKILNIKDLNNAMDYLIDQYGNYKLD